MKYTWLLGFLLIIGCAKTLAPFDNNNDSPDTVLKKAYEHILAGDLQTAETFFDQRLLKAVLPPTHPDTFESFYKKQTEGWTSADLHTEIFGNDYNPAVWRVRIGPADGRSGAVHDLAQIDGQWKIVYWGDWPKG